MYYLQRILLNRGYWEEAGDEGTPGGGGQGEESPSGEGDQGGTPGDEGAPPKQESALEGNPPPGNPASWRESIKDQELQKFVQNYNTAEDLAKSALSFRQKLSTAVSVPGKNATPEEIAEFNKRLGVPESADGYQFELPTDLPETVTAETLSPVLTNLKNELHKAGATPGVANAALSAAVDMIAKSHREAEENWNKAVSESQTALKEEWGAEYETNTNYAKRAFNQFGGEEFVQLLKDAKVGGVELINNPAMIKVFSNIGRKMGEGGMQYVMSDADVKTFEQKMDDLTSKAMDARYNGNEMEANKLFEERDRLAKDFYGDGQSASI